MVRKLIVPLATGLALALGACGSGGGDGGTASVTPDAAKAGIERAAHVKLAAEKVPGDAREQGLEASFSNAATAVKDEQIVAVFVMKDAGVADEVSDMVKASAPPSAKLIVHDEVMVVYATTGKDRTAALEKAVKAL